MFTIVLSTVLLGQCYIIDGRLVCPLPAASPQRPVATKPKRVVQKPKPKPQVLTYEKWY